MKKIGLILLTLSLSSYATDNKIPGVKKLKKKNDGSYLVKCLDGSKGFVLIEETNICISSLINAKNECNNQHIWTIEQAAQAICE